MNPSKVKLPDDLTLLHQQICAFLSQRNAVSKKQDSQKLSTFNPKGDQQYSFDQQLDSVVFNWLKGHFESGRVLSEESSGVRLFGQSKPRFRFVCDPVDGSDNFSRGLPFSTLSLALLTSHGDLTAENVLFAMVGNLAAKAPVIAAKSKGSWQNTTPLHVSAVQNIKDAFISCELNHHQPDEKLGHLLKNAQSVRSYGCASQAIVQVAQGKMDAHVDIRKRLTPESFLAAARILLEAGGALDIRYENNEKEPDSLTARANLIAASTQELLTQIKQQLLEA